MEVLIFQDLVAVLMFRDKMAEVGVQQVEVVEQEWFSLPETTLVSMAGPTNQHRMTLLASSQATRPPGIMPTQLQWQELLPMKEQQGGQGWELQWQGFGQGGRREEQGQVDNKEEEQLGQQLNK